MRIEYGLIGMPLGHSISPQIHEMLGNPDYRLLPVTEKEMETLLREKSFRGLNVTIPYKKAVLSFCDVISGRVEKTGCANTLICRDRRIYADNTDLLGFSEMLREAPFSVQGKKIAVLGSGGTSLTAQAVLRDMDAREILAVSRKGPLDYEKLRKDHEDLQIIVNTTPVGMSPGVNETPLPLNSFPCLEGVADVIYNPLKTRLLTEAEERGIPCMGGLRMLVCQAWHSAMQFQNREIPREKADAVYQAMLSLLEEHK